MGYLRRIKNRERKIAKAKNRKLYNTPKETSVRSRLRRQHAAELKQKLEIKEQQEAQIAAREMSDYKAVNETVAKDPEAYEKFLEKEKFLRVPILVTKKKLWDLRKLQILHKWTLRTKSTLLKSKLTKMNTYEQKPKRSTFPC